MNRNASVNDFVLTQMSQQSHLRIIGRCPASSSPNLVHQVHLHCGVQAISFRSCFPSVFDLAHQRPTVCCFRGYHLAILEALETTTAILQAILSLGERPWLNVITIYRKWSSGHFLSYHYFLTLPQMAALHLSKDEAAANFWRHTLSTQKRKTYDIKYSITATQRL
jgi:hypothetical protein